MLAKQLGLIDIKGFIKTGEEALYKVTTFVPESSADAVRLAWAMQGQAELAITSIVVSVSMGKDALLVMKILILSLGQLAL